MKSKMNKNFGKNPIGYKVDLLPNNRVCLIEKSLENI